MAGHGARIGQFRNACKFVAGRCEEKISCSTVNRVLKNELKRCRFSSFALGYEKGFCGELL
jgi:hypothetical protein